MKRITLILTFLLLWTMVCGLCVAHADVPHLIAYQGRLTDSQGTPREGSYSVTFRIYNAESGGVLRWQETHSNVTVTSGIFDVLLGSVSPINLPFNEQYYLAIQVGSDAEMTPRQQIASVGYAYKAEKAEEATEAINADTVDGIHASSTPEANKLIALNGSGKLSGSVLKTYDSGWFAIRTGATYVKSHNLNTLNVLTNVWVSNQASGVGANLEDSMAFSGAGIFGIHLIDLTTTQVTLATEDSRISTKDIWTSGYARIIMLALE